MKPAEAIDPNRATLGSPALRTASISDTEISYLDYGENGPPLLLLHATGFLPWLWHPVAQKLASEHWVIAPSFFQHRTADPHKGGLPWAKLAEDLKQFCAQLDIETSAMVGHSMGAAVATLAHAVLGVSLSKLVLIEPIFLPEVAYEMDLTVDDHFLAKQAIKRRSHWPDRDEAKSNWLSKPFFQTWDEQVLDLYLTHGLTEAEGGGVTLTCPPEQEAALFMGGGHLDPWPYLPKVSCPTLVVEGELSTNKPWIDLKRVQRLIPQGSYVEVEGAGHLVPMEKPQETAKLLREFFS
jgi:pimeloyl-ACP methyl ester carboxylesterase